MDCIGGEGDLPKDEHGDIPTPDSRFGLLSGGEMGGLFIFVPASPAGLYMKRARSIVFPLAVMFLLWVLAFSARSEPQFFDPLLLYGASSFGFFEEGIWWE